MGEGAKEMMEAYVEGKRGVVERGRKRERCEGGEEDRMRGKGGKERGGGAENVLKKVI